ncbi:citrate lyase subunit alpha [Peloplasma aerotolerans]|uniref:Citrate lyase alpha chain n=1 Tax=Peloplasma aerotolerans TaxID=3044389 RepID=A0AAW6UD15_9MOLU|nr:citrate lyase subunit alpha [Mariniplasma sp. M4Ah]MDI6453376.1 citrate lyase subunit alpha [Mariniplasma sp. M4Ah]
MKNSLNRLVPDGYTPYQGADTIIKSNQRKTIPKTLSKNKDKLISNLSVLFDKLSIKNGMTLSFHHHLRNGDDVLNMVLEEIKKRDLKDMILAPSSIFPIHQPMVDLIKRGNIVKIYTNYLNGPVADAISQGYLKDLCVMDSHGGRPRAIESGELVIDVAFIAVPTSDKDGNGNGIEGKSACGTLGYAISDLHYAKQKVVVTDHLVHQVTQNDIDGKYVDYVIQVDQIGEAEGIVSGTTKPTKDPVQLKIAKDTAQLIEELGYIKDNMTFQTGAGGTSLAVAQEVKKKMLIKKIQGSFASGGITSFLVEMHQIGLFKKLYDVQCFDLEAVESYKNNKNHHFMTASEYGNPYEDNPIVNQLDVVILGATEIDLDFNVNVTTDSHGNIIGGSGGHSDTAYGAKLTVITTNLIKSRTSMVKEIVTTVTTPGESIDCLVTERGIAINPKRQDLMAKLKYSKLKIVSIEQLYQQAMRITGVPKNIELEKRVIGLVRYRDGSIIDSIYQVRGQSHEL